MRVTTKRGMSCKDVSTSWPRSPCGGLPLTQAPIASPCVLEERLDVLCPDQTHIVTKSCHLARDKMRAGTSLHPDEIARILLSRLAIQQFAPAKVRSGSRPEVTRSRRQGQL
jgi:hypothetical protein